MMRADQNDRPAISGRRRVPRRAFEARVGVLLGGVYNVERSFQVGEGGMMISCDQVELKEGIQLVVSFHLPSGSLIMVRGMVRSVIEAREGLPERYGIEFMNVGFQSKREIRNFVAAATGGTAAALI